MIALPTHDTRKFARRIPQSFECNPTSAELVELFFRLVSCWSERSSRISDIVYSFVTFSDRFIIRTRASRTKHHPMCGRRRSPSFPTKRCCSWSRAAIAIATSSPISPGPVRKAVRRPVCRRSAISSRENPVGLSRREPNSLRRRLHARRHRRLPRLRPFAIALCRCMNIPARYCTGYLGDIGVPIDINPMDFSAWFEVFWPGAGTRKTRVTIIPASAALSWDAAATLPTSPCRPPSASPNSWSRW